MNRQSCSRRDFLRTLGISSFALMNGWHKSYNNFDRPNIVLILADDMGFSDIGCYGGEIDTPNLNTLAENGLRFRQFYNAARCCPTRASLLTGLYPQQTGHGHMEWDAGTDAYRGDLNNKCLTIAEALKLGGYSTYGSGKWHLTKQLGYWTPNHKFTSGTSKHNWPCQRGFDQWYGIITGAADYYNPNTLVRNNTAIKATKDDYYFTDEITDKSCNYILDHSRKKAKAPFFMYVAYTAPHWPLHALPEDIEKYKGRYSQGWDVLREKRYRRQVEMGIIDSRWKLPKRRKEYHHGMKDEIQRPLWKDVDDKAWQSKRMEVYAAMIDRMDKGIGKIINTLKDSGKLDNTLIIFLSDNGASHGRWPKKFSSGNKHMPEKTRDGRVVKMGDNPEVMPGPDNTYQSYGLWWAATSDTPFRKYKGWVHEGGISTPLIAHWPDRIKDKGVIKNQVGHVIDIMPTVLSAAGVKYPEIYNDRSLTPLEGLSLLPVIFGAKFTPNPIFWEHEGNAAARVGKWKLVRQNNAGGEGSWELYDIKTDRSETNDVAKKYPERVREMAAIWETWANRIGVLSWKDLKQRMLH